MLDACAPGHEIKPGKNHRYKIHFNGKVYFLDKGPGGATNRREDRKSVEIRIKKVAAAVAHFGICFKCAQGWFPDLKLPGNKVGEEVKSYCSEHMAKQSASSI